MGRRPIIAANWKMFKTHEESEAYVKELEIKGLELEGVDVILCVSFTSLLHIGNLLEKSEIKLGAQNMHWADEGAYTGEISPSMIRCTGADWVILGHSERRHVFRETDEEIVRKVRSALSHNLSPIFCIGETLEERKREETVEVLNRQLGPVLDSVSEMELNRSVVAYEPVWAIGTGENATPRQVEEAHHSIRRVVEEKLPGAADSLRILYGGSVKPQNAAELIGVDGVDGFLVGGASLEVDTFVTIARAVQAKAMESN